MGENSGIEWTDHTFNPWIGCTKVSPGCDHCYAEAYALRYGKTEWGTGKPRQLTSDGNWRKPHQWNKDAAAKGIRYRVFCASLADVFDNEVPSAWRVSLWDLIERTPHLDWLLLTKRIGNARHMLPSGWQSEGPWPNVCLGISVVNQEEAERDIPKLLATSARIKFLSMEPLLGPVTLWQWEWSEPGIDWVIVGGESGKDARPMQREWATSLRDQCNALGVPFFFKQWGEWGPILSTGNHGSLPYNNGMVKFGKKRAGRLLDGQEWNQLPAWDVA